MDERDEIILLFGRRLVKNLHAQAKKAALLDLRAAHTVRAVAFTLEACIDTALEVDKEVRSRKKREE